MKRQFTLQSTYDGLTLSGMVYAPENSPKGIVQLVHGMAEHKGRYQEIMEFLSEKGYVVVCHDHRGHGESILSEQDLGWFGDYAGNAVVEDTRAVTDYIKAEYPNLPLTLFGHSMGSLIVRCYIQRYDNLCDKLVVCGSPSKNGLAGVAIALEKCIRLVRGERHRSKLLKYLSTGKGAKRFAGEGGWLSRNEENIARYLADPKSGYLFTCNGYENLFKLLKKAYQLKRYEVKNPPLPVLFMAGSDDPVIVSEKAWRQAIAFLQKVGYKNVSGKLYEGMRHEILNEIGREEVFADLHSFIEE